MLLCSFFSVFFFFLLFFFLVCMNYYGCVPCFCLVFMDWCIHHHHSGMICASNFLKFRENNLIALSLTYRSESLKDHMKFLETQGIAGVSHHSLLFSKTAPVPVITEEEEVKRWYTDVSLLSLASTVGSYNLSRAFFFSHNKAQHAPTFLPLKHIVLPDSITQMFPLLF